MLGNILKKFTDPARDLFDANTQRDQQKRMAAGQPRMYGQQRQARQPSQQRPTPDFASELQVGRFSPMSQEERTGGDLLNKTADNFALSPNFTNTLRKDRPEVRQNELGFTQGQGVPEAAGLYRGVSLPDKNNIQVRPIRGGDSGQTLLHEGLHSAWEKQTPQSKARYAEALQRSLPTREQTGTTDPAIDRLSKAPLASPRDSFGRRFQGFYEDHYGVKTPKYIDDTTKLDPHILNEVQAEIPNYYFDRNQKLPTELAAYYNQYFDTNRAYQRQTAANTVKDITQQRFMPDDEERPRRQYQQSSGVGMLRDLLRSFF